MLLSRWFVGGWFSRCRRLPAEVWDGDVRPWERDVDRFLISRRENRAFVLDYIQLGIPLEKNREKDPNPLDTHFVLPQTPESKVRSTRDGLTSTTPVQKRPGTWKAHQISLSE